MKWIYFLLVLWSCSSALAQRPNVVVIYTDDHRYTGVHAMGGMQVQTPHMDALAADGVSFDRAYLMGSFSGATCIPSRAMLLTGRNLFGLKKGQGHQIPSEHKTMGETFRASGYHPYPWEVYDLSFFPENAELLQTLRKEMKARAAEIGDYKENVEGERFDFWDAYR